MVIADEVENAMNKKACNLRVQAAVSFPSLPESSFNRNDHVAQQVWIDRRIRPASHGEG
jgi:hypothetical protein